MQKSKAFALRIIKLYQYLKDEKHEYVMSKQLLRSGTSIGANVAEAQYGISRGDFLAKMYIALKESAETLYWLELLHGSNYLDEKAYQSILEDGEELKRLLSAITKSTKYNNSSLLTPNFLLPLVRHFRFLYLLCQIPSVRQILLPEVIDMNADGIWRSFVETGDPFCYLLAKQLEEQQRREKAEKTKRKNTADGELPRPQD